MKESSLKNNINNGRRFRNYLNHGILSLITLMLIFIVAGCDLNDADAIAEDEFTGVSESYELQELDGSGISGNLTLEERTDGTAQASFQLNGTESGASYPAHIHENTVVEGGEPTIPLESVDGKTGSSEITISDQNGTPMTYNELLDYDGHVNVHNGDNEVVAQGDLGGNQLTGESFTYNLDEVDESGISGEV